MAKMFPIPIQYISGICYSCGAWHTRVCSWQRGSNTRGPLVTQGDPLSMMMYAIAVLPLIQALVDQDKWDQNWYADYSVCSAELPRLREWFDKLCEMGPDFGYYPEPEKTVLVVDSKDEAVTDRLFVKLGVTVVTGHRFLGGFIGEQEGNDEHVKQKVQKWVQYVENLTKGAESQPQAVHEVLTKSFQFEWSYLQHVVPNCADAFVPLRDFINGKFIPAVLGGGFRSRRRPYFPYRPAWGEW